MPMRIGASLVTVANCSGSCTGGAARAVRVEFESMLRLLRLAISTALAVAVLFAGAMRHTGAVTRVSSADGQFWDIQDTSAWGQDSGGIATGGRAYPFNGFGYLKLQVRRPDAAVLVRNHYLTGFGLSHDPATGSAGAGRFDSTTPLLRGDVVVARAIFAPVDADYLRYFDSFTNVADEDRLVEVAWGGAAGAYDEGGLVAVATTSSGDRRIDLSDTFVTVMQNARRVDDPMRGPSGHGPSAHVLGSRAGLLAAAGDMYADPFTDRWPGYDPAHLGYVFTFTLRPGQTTALVTFVVKGLSELYDSRGDGPAVRIRDGVVAPPQAAGDPKSIPAPGSEIARVTAIARRLVSAPDLRGLTALQRSQIANWTLPAAPAPPSFAVFEKTVEQLQDAMTRGTTTSEDIVREYLARLTRFDRNGPALRSMLALNRRVLADARGSDAERAAGRVRGPFHGIPVAYKDNIDALGLPTTGGSLALAEHLPRLDSRMAAGMRAAGAIVLGKTNLDEFPFGDFGISSVAGTIGNAYDPSLSTAGSSGGSAVAVSTSLVTLAFGTDTCNSLSNPAAFAALATIRTTRGQTSRAGVMPLNPYNDAVGPMAKSVREVALALDQVAGPDSEDAVTGEAARHAGGSFAADLSPSALQGARIGLLRQRFVGFTGEREIAALMDTVAAELRAAGAALVEVNAPDIEARYRAARSSEPGALAAAWASYLSRGAKPGEKVLTLEDLLASGKLAPISARRFEAALAPIPTGDDLREAVRAFTASREAFRDFFVALMDAQRLDALLYPANLARPHTHEGGLERFGGEPSTCAESAMTGLPQVTVPGGFAGGRYPVGVSFLGRMWSDRRLLALAYAYEQATHHRRPPSTVR
jgi:amidase